MNQHALGILEYDKIKESITNMAISDLGKAMIDQLVPSNDMDRIKNQLNEVTQQGPFLIQHQPYHYRIWWVLMAS